MADTQVASNVTPAEITSSVDNATATNVAGATPEAKSPAKIFLGNLPEDTSEESLKKVFEGICDVENTRIIERKRRGIRYAFVTPKDKSQIDSIVEKLGKLKLGENEIRVEAASAEPTNRAPQPRRRGFVRARNPRGGRRVARVDQGEDGLELDEGILNQEGGSESNENGVGAEGRKPSERRAARPRLRGRNRRHSRTARLVRAKGDKIDTQVYVDWPIAKDASEKPTEEQIKAAFEGFEVTEVAVRNRCAFLTVPNAEVRDAIVNKFASSTARAGNIPLKVDFAYTLKKSSGAAPSAEPKAASSDEVPASAVPAQTNV
ncbi:hypothetical protein EV182_004488 [Spiromyces aspiralis]|uniref:Uncharacterized protein n=1 Tax=Spiromyces aspiralis TaxID=68401 RepID=A0ACC1HSC6_9FUNG|nr:hypothetical protein EV182_004488 [Spiromyces aspiralis]